MAGTDSTKRFDLGPAPAVILVNPQMGENIGAAARAMANFGLRELRIVDPRDGWPNGRAEATSSGALWIIEDTVVMPDLPSAIADLNFVYATTARPRGMIKDVMTPEEAGLDMRRRIAEGERVGILFGRERWGLDNDEVAQADVIVTAPVNPGFASLNIAQAVLLVAYEWFRHHAPSLGMGTEEAPALAGSGLTMPGTRPATKAELDGLIGHLEAELETAGFFKSPDMRPTILRNLRNLFHRARFSEQEVRTLRGVVASLARAHLRRRGGEGP